MNFLPIMTESEARNVNTLALAFLGDAVESLYVRETLINKHDLKAGDLHKMASEVVNAHRQAEKADKIFCKLTESERDVYMRGRNGKSRHTAKNQTRADYHKATGLEALLGYLYLTGNDCRILELLKEDE